MSKKIGILINNLGTPDAPTAKALRRYLAEFLSDQRVVELPKILWLPILYGIILLLRPKKSAHSYQAIWTEQGSPLLVHSQAICDSLQQRFGDEVRVELGMRYGNPSIKSALKKLRDFGAEHIIVLPLYPQYSAATVASCFDEVSKQLQQQRVVPSLQFINHYYQFSGYQTAVAQQIRSYLSNNPTPHKLLFSFHGMPEVTRKKGDLYYDQCIESAEKIANLAGLPDDLWQVSFQSRFGYQPWLQPYTDETLQTLAKQDQRRVAVICPGFAVDCLETLEEIAMQYCQLFLDAGGEQFDYLPALNASDGQIDLLQSLLAPYLV